MHCTVSVFCGLAHVLRIDYYEYCLNGAVTKERQKTFFAVTPPI